MKTTIKEIFQAEGYSIPNYQRDYAWKDKNFKDLWEDLEEAIEYNKKGQGHFIGIMVVAKNEDNKKLYDIIDGQQRTTTIFMLLHVLANEQNEKDKQETRKYLYQKGGIKIRSRPLKTKASSKRSWKRQKRGISAIVKKMQTPRVSKISLRF